MNELSQSSEREGSTRLAYLRSRFPFLIRPSVAVWAPIPLRLIVGYGFMEHGFAKLSKGPEVFAAILHTIGVPAPHLMAWLTILTELIGGLAVLLGAFVPLVSLPMAGLLFVAILTVHLPYGFSSIKLMSVMAGRAQFGPPGYEVDLLYLACLAALVLGGSGPMAIDGLLRKWRKNGHSFLDQSHGGVSGCVLKQATNHQNRLLERSSILNKKQTIRIARLTLAAAAALTITGHVAARNRPSKVVLLRPAELPELAQVTGQAMVLHATGNGRTLLYVEQNDGARLAIFDVSNLDKIKQEPAAQLDAPGSFDFVSSLGDYAELIRFRDGQGEAVLDLHKAMVPTIKIVPGLEFHGSAERLIGDGFTIANQASVQSDATPRDYQIFAAVHSREPERVYDVKQVRHEITNDETGTTFLLGADGLYVIRRLAVEEEYDVHQQQMSHPG